MRLLPRCVLAWVLAGPLVFSPGAVRAAPGDGEAARLVEQIVEGDQPAVDRALGRLAFLGRPPLAGRLLAKALLSASGQARQNIAYALASLPYPALAPQVAELLSDEEPAVRFQACIAAGRLKARSQATPLARLLSDPAAPLRREAARALGLLGARGPEPKLLELALREGEDREVRLAALVALGQINSQATSLKLKPLLRSRSEELRLAAGRALCLAGDSEARQVALRMVGSGQPYERRDAVSLLEGLRPPWARNALAQLLADPSLEVRIAAAKGLGLSRDGRGVERLVVEAENSPPEERVRIEQALREMQVSDADRSKILRHARK